MTYPRIPDKVQFRQLSTLVFRLQQHISKPLIRTQPRTSQVPIDQLENLDTNVLVNLYTLLSDVQRNANDLRQEIANTLLDRLHHDRPVAGQYGSVQRTTRKRRELKDENEVLTLIEDAGINRERVMGVDRDKVDDGLEVSELSVRFVFLRTLRRSYYRLRLSSLCQWKRD